MSTLNETAEAVTMYMTGEISDFREWLKQYDKYYLNLPHGEAARDVPFSSLIAEQLTEDEIVSLRDELAERLSKPGAIRPTRELSQALDNVRYSKHLYDGLAFKAKGDYRDLLSDFDKALVSFEKARGGDEVREKVHQEFLEQVNEPESDIEQSVDVEYEI